MNFFGNNVKPSRPYAKYDSLTLYSIAKQCEVSLKAVPVGSPEKLDLAKKLTAIKTEQILRGDIYTNEEY